MNDSVEHLGLKTDIFFLEHDCVVKEHPDFISVETPSNPTFYGGNFLLLKKTPNQHRTGKIGKAVFLLIRAQPTDQTRHFQMEQY